MMLLYSVIGSALAGTGVIVVLTMGYGTLQPILMAAAAGAVIGLPVSWLVAKNLA
jgi:hypothetical protein